jgi:hypothetical protein
VFTVLFYIRKGIAVDRLVGFEDLGGKDDFSTRALENILKRKGRDNCYFSLCVYASLELWLPF